ncbi:MAG: hypothetical protein ACP5SD_05790 [Elusimicrobiales bacterium]
MENDFNNIDYKKYDFLYIGSEFCQFKIPKLEHIKKITHKNIVLLTPIITDNCFKNIIKILETTSVKEITVNDMGLFYFLTKNKTKKKINIGRVLISNLSKSIGWGKLKKIFENIEAYEIDNTTEPGIIKNLTKINLHIPFSYLTHTRNCAFKAEGNCPCADRYIKMKSAISKNIFLNSNAYFLYDPQIKNKRKIKRIVYHILNQRKGQ